MDIDNAPDPNELYIPIIRTFGTGIDKEGNDNDVMLNVVLLELARAVPDRTFDIDSLPFAAIKALHMNDLRDLLNSGNYEKAAREVLRRCIAGETLRCVALRSDHIWSIAKQMPAPSLPDTLGGRE